MTIRCQTSDMLHSSQKREMNITSGPLAHLMVCTCASETFLINLKTFSKSTGAVPIAALGEHANIFTPNDCMDFVSWIDEVGAASNNEVNARMKWIKKLRFAKYDVMHPNNEVPAYKSMRAQDLYALFDPMLDI